MAVLPEGVVPTRVVVDLRTGIIESLDPASLPIDESCLLFPGFIDIHVHAREFVKPPDQIADQIKKWELLCNKEVFLSAGHAAINGGVTCFAAMPNDPMPPDNERRYGQKAALAEQSQCPVILFAAITETSEPWADLPYKVYLDAEPSHVSFSDWKTLEEVIKRYRRRRLFFHAEDPEILRNNSGYSEHWKKRPPEAEVRAVENILNLTHKYDLLSHICHVSTESAVKLIGEYNNSSSTRVTCEVTPHHLFFSVDENGYLADGLRTDLPGFLLNCNPPIRSEGDRSSMIEALRSGTIQVLASDHAPHLLADKRLGAPGIPHLDTLGPFVGWLIKNCGFEPTRIAQILSEEPSNIMASNLQKKHGRIEKGYSASLTLLDFDKTTEVVTIDGHASNRKLFTRCGWSPFQNISLPAYVKLTVINGVSLDYGVDPQMNLTTSDS